MERKKCRYALRIEAPRGVGWKIFDYLMSKWRIFSKRQRITLRLLYAIGRPSVVCRLSVVCDVGAPYSGG